MAAVYHGRTHLSAGRPGLALPWLEWGVSWYPWWRQAHRDCCFAARQAGQFDKAWEHLAELEQGIQPLDGEGPLIWALIRAAQGDLPLVESQLLEIWNRDPERRTEIASALTEGYLRMYRLPDALAITNEWLRVDPDSVRALVLRADAWYRARSPDNAVPALQTVIDHDPAQTESRFHLALALLDKARYDDALGHLDIVAREWPENTVVPCRQARCLFMLGREKQARTLLEEKIAAYPEDFRFHSTLGQIDLLSGRNEEAANQFLKALAIQPTDYQSLFSVSQALNRLGKTQLATRYAKEAEVIKTKLQRINDITSNEIAKRPLDPALHEELALLFESTGQWDSARAWFESATRIDPTRVKSQEGKVRMENRNQGTPGALATGDEGGR